MSCNGLVLWSGIRGAAARRPGSHTSSDAQSTAAPGRGRARHRPARNLAAAQASYQPPPAGTQCPAE